MKLESAFSMRGMVGECWKERRECQGAEGNKVEIGLRGLRGRRQRDKAERVGRERPSDGSSPGVGQAMHVARCPGGEQTQKEETWNGVQPDGWVTKEQLASFSHEDRGGPA